MNRFIIDYDVVSIAQSLCDQHIVKMPLEECQMLCTALWHHAPEYAEENDLYKPVHQKHPCTLWAMHSRDNYEFAWNLYFAMCQEYRLRYNRFHGCGKHEDALTLYDLALELDKTDVDALMNMAVTLNYLG